MFPVPMRMAAFPNSITILGCHLLLNNLQLKSIKINILPCNWRVCERGYVHGDVDWCWFPRSDSTFSDMHCHSQAFWWHTEFPLIFTKDHVIIVTLHHHTYRRQDMTSLPDYFNRLLHRQTIDFSFHHPPSTLSFACRP